MLTQQAASSLLVSVALFVGACSTGSAVADGFCDSAPRPPDLKGELSVVAEFASDARQVRQWISDQPAPPWREGRVLAGVAPSEPVTICYLDGTVTNVATENPPQAGRFVFLYAGGASTIESVAFGATSDLPIKHP